MRAKRIGPYTQRCDFVTWSNDSGHYTVDELPSGDVFLVVDNTEFPLWKSEQTSMTAATVAQRDVQLEFGVVVSGQVTDEGGTALGDVPLAQAMRMPYPTPPFDRYHVVETRTNDEGLYRLAGIAPGHIRLVAGPVDGGGGGTRGFQETTMLGSPGAELGWDVQFREGLAIEGDVLFENGDPAVGWRAAAYPLDFDGAVPQRRHYRRSRAVHDQTLF